MRGNCRFCRGTGQKRRYEPHRVLISGSERYDMVARVVLRECDACDGTGGDSIGNMSAEHFALDLRGIARENRRIEKT